MNSMVMMGLGLEDNEDNDRVETHNENQDNEIPVINIEDANENMEQVD